MVLNLKSNISIEIVFFYSYYVVAFLLLSVFETPYKAIAVDSLYNTENDETVDSNKGGGRTGLRGLLASPYSFIAPPFTCYRLIVVRYSTPLVLS